PKVQVAAKPEKTPRGFIAFIALLALLLAAVTWVGPMLAAADKPLDANKKPIAEAVKSGLKSNWPVPVYGDVFENITDWNEGQLPLVVFIGAMLLFGLLPMPYMLRALVIGGAGAAMFVLAAKQGVDTKTIPLALLDDKVYGLPSGAILLGTLLMPIALFMRGHYRDSTLARILVALGLLVTAFVYGGIQLIDTAHFKNVVLLQQIDGITKGKFLADKLQAVMLTLPLVFSVLGVLAFMDKTKSGLCGLWGFLWVVSVFGSPLVYTIFSTRSADWKSVGAVAGVGFGAWLLAIGLTMTIGLGHFLGEIGKKVSKPD
ncbi:MAG: hypothetical protein KC609_11570, partial [Myxococcales bacterium]|nr:hypothetical protein [Myxococcales bacterium]